MRKIAILNFKGGTGKTTTAVNLDHALSLKDFKAFFFPLKDILLSKYDQNYNIVIIDSYILPDFNFQKAFYIRIDDFCNLPKYSSDVIINPNLESENLYSCYKRKTYEYTKLLLGEENIILDPKFSELSRIIEKGMITIFLGGSGRSIEHQILNILDICQRIEEIKQINLVVTRNYSKRIRTYISEKVEIHFEPKSLINLIKKTEWGIISAGIIKYEFAAFQIPILIFSVIEHQQKLGKIAEKYNLGSYGGFLQYLTFFEIQTCIESLISLIERKKVVYVDKYKGIQNLTSIILEYLQNYYISKRVLKM